MNQYLAIAIGGALGSLARFAASQAAHAYWGKAFPWGTLLVNAIGSFLIGILFVVIVEKQHWSDLARLFLLVGFLGAFTTFSTFSLENLQLLAQGEVIKALANVVANVVLGLVLVWLGVSFSRHLL